MAKLRGKAKRDFLERMARGRKKAARRGAAGSGSGRKTVKARCRRRRASNPDLVTISNRSPRGRRKVARASTGRRRGVSVKRRNPDLLTIANPTTMRKAVDAYRQFHGVDPKKATKGRGKGVLIALGELQEVVYRPNRGKRKGPAFFHKFKAGNVLAVTPDGKRLVIVDRDNRKAVDFDLGIIS